MLKTLRGTLFLSFAGRKTMLRLWSLYWLEKSVPGTIFQQLGNSTGISLDHVTNFGSTVNGTA